MHAHDNRLLVHTGRRFIFTIFRQPSDSLQTALTLLLPCLLSR